MGRRVKSSEADRLPSNAGGSPHNRISRNHTTTRISRNHTTTRISRTVYDQVQFSKIITTLAD